MKKVKVLILLIVCGLFNVNVFGVGVTRSALAAAKAQKSDSDETKPTRTFAPANRNVSEKKVVVNKTLPRTSRQGRKPVTTATAQKRTTGGVTRSQLREQGRGGRVTRVSTVQAPENVNELVWTKLSDDQKIQFNALNSNFVKTVALPADDFALWRDTVVEQAKMIVDINSLLRAYCLKVIGAELERISEDGMGINPAVELQSIASELQTYIPEYILMTGTEKEQFDGLMRHIPFAEMNKPTDEWLKAVVMRTRNLVANKTLTIEDVRKALMGAFNKVARQFRGEAERLRLVNTIVGNTEQYVRKIEKENSSEYINDRFQNLLLTLVDNDNWDMVKKAPKEEWINNIVEASKSMIAHFNTPIAEIKQQIGAEVYFVAVTKAGRFLNPQEENKVIKLVEEDIIRRIK